MPLRFSLLVGSLKRKASTGAHTKNQRGRSDEQLAMKETKVWAYVFITTRQPRKVVQAIRKIPGVVKADGLFGIPDAIALVEGSDMASMDAVIDKIAEVPDVVGTDSKVARWIN